MTFKEKLNTISVMLYSLIKPLLFKLDPETAHNLALEVASLSPELGKISGTRPDACERVRVGNLHWTSPVALAAGLDKNAQALSFFAAQGFGALECGTITLRPQLGNPRPRMFRYPGEQSLRNAMGFPNQGVLEVLPRLQAYDHSVPLGINIGKNKETSPEESIEELALLFQTLRDEGDYFVVNVSSPNTPGLRELQEKSYLSELFDELNRHRAGKDLYLKIAPDLEENKLEELTKLVVDFRLTGMIATNTTVMPELGSGGVSGVLLARKSREVRRLILNQQAPLELIGVGGISSLQDLLDLWWDGGKACQVYTAYIYQGPQLLKLLNSGVRKFLTTSGVTLDEFFEQPLAQRRQLLKNYPA